MAWIESHQSLERHPKTLNLMTVMGWELDVAIGKLHRFWWWCVDYAPDGDLRKHSNAILAAAVGLNPVVGDQFVEAMMNCGGIVNGQRSHGFIEREPYFRLRNWWKRAGRFLQARLRNEPEKWQSIRLAYVETYAKQETPTNQHNQQTKTYVDPTKSESTGTASTSPNGAQSPDKPTAENLMSLWNSEAHPNLPRVELLTETRKKHIVARLREHSEVAFWKNLMQRINSSPLLTGQVSPKGGGVHPWRATFDWVLNPANLTKIIEGNYDKPRK